ncbi:MAG: TIR domain-containing protein [Saprospiraceae bacterium]|nr:TIR domain-containing protein [Saprospiraceae bacterium]
MDNVRDLIAAGRLEDALDILAKSNPDAVLLKGRYSSGKRQYSMGLVDFSEWQRVQNQIAYAALELAGDAGKGASAKDNPSGAPKPPASKEPSVQKKVFISYNHGDADTAVKIQEALANAGLEVIIDRKDMPAGMKIMDFIQQSIRAADVVLSVVSAKSLRSGWVGQESVASIYAVWLADKQFIPVRLDDEVFDIDFQLETQDKLNQKIDELDGKLTRLRQSGGSDEAFREDLTRMIDLKNNMGKILQRLNSVLILDVRPDQFQHSLEKVIQTIQA